MIGLVTVIVIWYLIWSHYGWTGVAIVAVPLWLGHIIIAFAANERQR